MFGPFDSTSESGDGVDAFGCCPFPEATKPFTPIHLRFNGELSECCFWKRRDKTKWNII